MWSLIRFADCFRERLLYNYVPVLNLCDRVSLWYCLVFSFSLFHAFLIIMLMLSFIFVICVDFNLWYEEVYSFLSFFRIVFFVSMSAFSFSSIFIWSDIHSILNLRFDLWICNSSRLWRMLWIIYYPNCCIGLSIAYIADWLSMYI